MSSQCKGHGADKPFSGVEGQGYLDQEVRATHRESVRAGHAREPWFPSGTLQEGEKVQGHHDGSGLNMAKVPARHLGPSRHTHTRHIRCSPGHFASHLLSMRADGTLRPRQTLYTGREKSQARGVGALSSSSTPSRAEAGRLETECPVPIWA